VLEYFFQGGNHYEPKNKAMKVLRYSSYDTPESRSTSPAPAPHSGQPDQGITAKKRSRQKE